MSSNKRVKDEMIKIFGKRCFLEELHIRKKSEVKKEIKKFKGKCQRCIMDQLTYHHILMKCKGGKATIENGAILRNINHIWLHRLPKEQQDKINELFQEYKKLFMEELSVEYVDDLKSEIGLNIAELEVTDKGIKVKPKGKYNRAEVKRETREAQEEYERGD